MLSIADAPHVNTFAARSTSKNGRLFSGDLEIILLSAARWPVSLCTAFLFVEGSIWSTASICVGLASIPFLETRQPRNFPFSIRKILFSGLSLRPALRKLMNVSLKSAMWSSFFVLCTMMSLTYVSTFLPHWSPVTFVVIRLKLPPAFLSPSGIRT